MRIKWLGHASMFITSVDGLRVLTDILFIPVGGNFTIDARRKTRGSRALSTVDGNYEGD